MSSILNATLSYQEITTGDKSKIGTKGISISEMSKLKIPVPQGFIVSSDAYFYFLDISRIREKIADIIENVNLDDMGRINKLSYW